MMDRRLCWVLPLCAVVATGCGWVDSSGRQENRTPELLELTHLVLESRENISLGVVDEDQNLASMDYELVDQGGDLNSLCIAFGGVLAGVAASDFEASCDPAVEGSCEAVVLEAELLKSELLIRETPTLRRPVAQQYQVSLQDTDGASSQQLLTLCIASESTAPVAQNDEYNVEYNAVRTVGGKLFDFNCDPDQELGLSSGVLINDSDDFDYSEDDANAQQCLVAELVTPPALHEGVFSLESDGGFSYGAGATIGVGMTDSFTYRVTDGLNFSNTATVSFEITGENSVPVPTNPTRVVNEGDVLTLVAADLATDAESGVISLLSVSDPVADPVLGAINWDVAELNYVAGLGGFGSDSFDYTVEDSGGALASGSVSVTVNALPTVVAEQGAVVALTAGDVGSLLFTLFDAEDAVSSLSLAVDSSDSAVVTTTEMEELDVGTAGNWQVDFTAINAGTADVTLTVTDMAGGSNVSPLVIAVIVDAAALQGPLLESPLLEATVGVPVEFNIVSDALATDADGNDTDLTFSSLPVAAGEVFTLSGGDKTFEFTPTTAGAVAVNVTIIDEDLNSVTGDLTVTVAAAPLQDPQLESPLLEATEGEAVTFNIVIDELATDADGNDSDLTFSSVPTALGEVFTLSGGNKTFGFTPTTAGAVTVEVTIVDEDGNTVTGDLTVTVGSA